MIYVKLVDGNLVSAPVGLVDGPVTHYHPKVENAPIEGILAADGNRSTHRRSGENEDLYSLF
jgi:hypothetical protein